MPDDLSVPVPPSSAPAGEVKLSSAEGLKEHSHRLRGTLAEELGAGGTQVSEDAYQLLKFHGTYEQHDRDTATELKQQGLEKDYSFMVRVRMPGGLLTAAQFLALDGLADRYGNGTLRITTRQGIQFHGVVKDDLQPAIADINKTLLTTQAACGDVVRNVMCSPAPVRDAVHARLEADARALSAALLPASRAYHEIFLGEAPGGGGDEFEPLYGPTYLPRKFKIAVATPDDNSVDIFTHDLGLVAVFEGDALKGYNVSVGGGLGMTHNKKGTYPRLGSIIGSVGPDEMVALTKAVIGVQRDNGGRTDRKRARLKYVVDDRGVDWVRNEVGSYLGHPLAAPLPTGTFAMPELLGWHEQGDGRLWLGVPIPSGRIEGGLRLALRAIVERFSVAPVMTPQQDVLLTDVAPAARPAIDAALREHGVAANETLSPIARWALACPALPTCGLALTEAERVRAPLVETFEELFRAHGLADERVSLRITGCPNGCARTYAGDIGLVGRVPGSYAIYVGGDFEGTRLSFQLKDRVLHADIPSLMAPIVASFARERQQGEGFGNYCDRIGRDALLALA